MWIVFLLATLVATTGTSAGLHEFHVSNMEITYRTSTRSLEVTLHLFVDDVEVALKAYSDEQLHLCTEREIPKASELLETYLRDHLAFSVDGEEVPFNFLGKEPGEDIMSMYCYLEVNDLERGKPIGISNSLLTEVYKDQKNIVNIGVDREKRQYILFDDRTKRKEVRL